MGITLLPSSTSHSTQTPTQPIGLLRCLAAQVYDALLVTTLLIAATALAIALLALLGGSEQFAETNPLSGNPWFTLYLLVIAAGFFVGFWTHGGQTLGMRAWHIRVCHQAGGPVHPARALLRFFGALLSWASLGLGYLWMVVDSQGLSWHDRISGTRLEHYRRR